MTTASKSHMARVAQLPCSVCGDQPVHVHHLREGQGMAQRGDDWLTIPLCPDCHTGKNGVHGDKTMMRIKKVGEMDLLAQTLEALYGSIR